MKIIDFNQCKENNKAYGGMAGSKLGIIYENEDWMLKFPKSTKHMRNVELSYTTAPLSEYIGSHIYALLGYDVHKTLLGIRDNKLVVACKDFTSPSLQLQEFREIKNYYNEDLETILEQTVSTSDSKGRISLEAICLHLELNPLLNAIEGIQERFWDCAVIDGLINNNDRNSGNWGVLRSINGDILPAPIFDNGASFSTKLSEQQVSSLLKQEDRFISSATNTITGFMLNDVPLHFKKLLELDDPNLQQSILTVVPKIEQSWNSIVNMLNEIPEVFEGIKVMNKNYKEFLIKGMEVRMSELLIPAYNQIQSENMMYNNDFSLGTLNQ